jgi:K+-transporting ATPase ATPase B chain
MSDLFARLRARFTSSQSVPLVSVGAGEYIPFDGLVIEGNARVDESAVSGVSTPEIIDATPGHDHVNEGGFVLEGSLKIRPLVNR